MTYRTIKTLTGQAQAWAKVQWSAEWQEYRVRFYKHAEYQSEADYFTDDKADALGTAHAEINHGPLAS